MKTLLILIALVTFVPGLPIPARASDSGVLPQIVQNLWKNFRQSQVSLNDLQKEAFVSQSMKENFDFIALYQVALQEHWPSWTEEQKKEFSASFETLFLWNLSKQIKKIPLTKISLTTTNFQQNGDRAVQFFSVRKGTDSYSFKVFFIRQGSTWKIYDEEVEGALLSRNYRAQFNRILRNEGYQGLLSRLQGKLNDKGA